MRILTQDEDTTTSAGGLVFSILSAVVEMERKLSRERVHPGMVRARAQGETARAAAPGHASQRSPRLAVVIAGMEAGHLRRASAARRLHVRRASLDAALQLV